MKTQYWNPIEKNEKTILKSFFNLGFLDSCSPIFLFLIRLNCYLISDFFRYFILTRNVVLQTQTKLILEFLTKGVLSRKNSDMYGQ